MREKILHFMHITNPTDTTEALIASMVAQFREGCVGHIEGELPAHLAKALDEALTFIDATLRAKKTALIDALVDVHAKYFSEEEIDDLVSFYETPAGRRLVAISSNLGRDIGSTGTAWSLNAMKGTETELARILG